MHEEFVKYLKTYQPDDFLIREGDEDRDFFCLLKGKVGIWKGNTDDRESLVKIGELSEKGSYFGEMSYLLQEARTASITALDEPIKVLRFPGEMLPQMMLSQPKLSVKLCTTLANHLKGTTTAQQEASLHRNEIREDATSQFLHAKLAFQKVFVMLTSIQKQLQNPNVKACIEFMSHDKLLQGGRKTRIDDNFLEDIPDRLVDLVKTAYADLIT